MPDNRKYDTVVVGSGPNGLSASITLAKAGCSVLLLEGRNTVGGGTRTEELTLPGFRHDTCSAIHAVGAASPFFRSLNLADYGLEWINPPVPLAHPLDDGTAVMLKRSVEDTGEALGVDSAAYRRLMTPLVDIWDGVATDLLRPLGIPNHPAGFLRFGRHAIYPVRGFAERCFKTDRAQALFAGLGAHSILPLEQRWSSAFALVLGIFGHAVGWPLARGGSQKIADALAGHLRSLGGEIETGVFVESIDQLPESTAVLFDVTPRQLVHIAGNRFPAAYVRQVQRHRYGPGVFKVDWALHHPIPWKADECGSAATVHMGGTLEEIASSERAVWRGEHPDKPFVILVQPSLFDPERAPAGKHTAWAYCHVPNGSTFDMTGRIEAQVERFAPGFRECVLTRNIMTPASLEEYNPNYVGGDIAGGAQEFRQLFLLPALRRHSYSTPARGIYMCSSSSPPGAGVHGMCGYHAARKALGDLF